jgi:hypothetical protein
VPGKELTMTVILEETPQGRKTISDFIRMAHCLMSVTEICRAIEDGSYLEIVAGKELKTPLEGSDEQTPG